MSDYKNTMGLVKVKFKNPKYNYSTNVSGNVKEAEAIKYFVGKKFDVGTYPKENMQEVSDIEFFPKGTYAKGGLMEYGLRKGDSLGSTKDNKVIVYPNNKEEQYSVKVVNVNKGKRIDAKDYIKMSEKEQSNFDKMAKGGKMASPKPKMVRTQFEEEEFEYGKGGSMDDDDNTQNGKYLDNISKEKKSKILKNVASHYRISIEEAEDEVRDDDAEMLYEYIANDKSLQMEIYNDMNKNKMGKGGKTQNGKLKVGVYRVGKPTRISPNAYEQKIVEIFENGDIATASDYGRKLADFKSQKYPIISKEALEMQYKMGKGGAIYKGDKVRIKDSNKSMVVKDISKGKKGYVEFSGDKGTYLKGDLDKYAKGGKTASPKPKMVRTQFEEEEFEYGSGGKVSKSEKEKLSNLAYQLQNADDGWISKNHGKFVQMQNEYKKQFKKVYGHTNYSDPNRYGDGGMVNNFCYSIGGL